MTFIYELDLDIRALAWCDIITAVLPFAVQSHGHVTRYHRLSVIHLRLLQGPVTSLTVNYLLEHMTNNSILSVRGRGHKSLLYCTLLFTLPYLPSIRSVNLQ